MARNKGKVFEDNVKASAQKQNIYIDRIHDTDLSFNGNSVSSYTPPNKCDFYMFGNVFEGRGNLFALECKSTKYPSISIQRTENDSDKKMIRYEQIQSLRKIALSTGVYAGFMLNFRDEDNETEQTFYISIEDFDDFLNNNDKSSINIQDCKIRAIPVEGTKLIKNYRYDMNKMIQDVTSK